MTIEKNMAYTSAKWDDKGVKCKDNPSYAIASSY